MSQWTHVSGIVRLDGIPSEPHSEVEAIKSRLGKTFTYDDSSEVWASCTVPRGSEGSLQYEVRITGRPSSLSRGHVAIWGDLRDFSDASKIVQWVKRVFDDDGDKWSFFIRQGRVDIEVEGDDIVSLFWNDGHWELT